jgi:ketosteroid isomerase-like protein
LFAAVLGLCAAGSVGAADPAARFTTADSAAIEQLIVEYFQAFTQSDFARLNQLFTAPFVLVGPEPRVLPTLQDAVTAWTHTRERLNGTDYAVSKPVHIRVVGLTPRTGLANIYWQRLTKSGTVMSEGAEFYFVTKKSGRWQIDGNMGEQLAQYQGPR